jgi:hypothetical protein
LAVASGENPIVRQLRAEVERSARLAQVMACTADNATEYRQQVEAERDAAELKLAEVEFAIDESERVGNLGDTLRANLRAILNQPTVSSEKFGEEIS